MSWYSIGALSLLWGDARNKTVLVDTADLSYDIRQNHNVAVSHPIRTTKM